MKTCSAKYHVDVQNVQSRHPNRPGSFSTDANEHPRKQPACPSSPRNPHQSVISAPPAMTTGTHCVSTQSYSGKRRFSLRKAAKYSEVVWPEPTNVIRRHERNGRFYNPHRKRCATRRTLAVLETNRANHSRTNRRVGRNTHPICIDSTCVG